MIKSSYTPLHYAAWCGHLSVVRMLVSQHNVDINACNDVGISPLQLVSIKGHKDNIVRAMINRKADFEGVPNTQPQNFFLSCL